MKSKKIAIIVGVVAILVVVFVALFVVKGPKHQGQTAELGKVLAQVDGLKLYEKDLEYFRGAGYRWNEEEKKKFVEQWVKYALMYLAAKESGFANNPEVRRKIELNSQFALVQEFENQKLKDIQVQSDEVDSIFKLHADKFRYSIDLLIVYAPDEAKRAEVIKKLKGKRGSNLFNAVEQLKADTSLTVFETGDMNFGVFYMSYNEFNRALRDKVLNLAEGQIDCVPAPEGGFICAYMLSKKRQTDVEDPRIKNFIYQYLLNQKQKAFEDSIISEMEQKYEVKIFIDTTNIQR